MTDETSQRNMPLLCFQCGMPVNNKQALFDELMLDGVAPLEAFESLDIRRACCRVMVNTAAVDPRLRRKIKERQGFAKVEKASRLAAQAFVLGTDGATDPIEDGGGPATSTTVPPAVPSI